MEKIPERYGLRIDSLTASVERLIPCESTSEIKAVGVSKSSVIRRKVAKYRYLLVRGGLSVYQRRRVERQLAHNERKLDALASAMYDVPIMVAPYSRIELNGCLDRDVVERVKHIQYYCQKCKRMVHLRTDANGDAYYSKRVLRAISQRIAKGLMVTCRTCDSHSISDVRIAGKRSRKG